ncbi:MAG: type II toxin-antitoxin system RelE/ParE family toxin [Asticcacaulis sp.]
MPVSKLSQEADQDFASIYVYGFHTFGSAQVDLYALHLIGSFERLAQYPLSGIARPGLADGLRSSACSSHVIYYLPEEGECLIVRILHQSQDPLRYI